VRRALLALAAAFALAGCVSLDGGDHDHDHDRDDDRPKAEERARKYCTDAAKAHGFRVDKIGGVEKVGKKQYDVKLRLKTKNKELKKSDDEGVRRVCRYDDKSRHASLF
jgi:hypothetical protein